MTETMAVGQFRNREWGEMLRLRAEPSVRAHRGRASCLYLFPIGDVSTKSDFLTFL